MLKFSTVYKCLQRKCYDLLSLQYSFLLIVLFGFLFMMSLIHFGEAWVDWSRKKYEAIFNSYSDNIAGQPFHDKLCQKVPVDVVYTWVNGSDPLFLKDLHAAIQDIQDPSVLNETFSSRFEDMEELRYSLRSLEMYAPWVHHVFLVTNGQIPYWLDMDHPKLTVVTHREIFTNQSHLPTFSSPSIESHLHRIPGLSKHFLYLNDDIIFGRTVWPEDFLTESEGYKIFITWNLPDCSPTCTWSWVGDGVCDPPCNVEQCSHDGGDCASNSSYPKYEYFQMNGPLYGADMDGEVEKNVKVAEEHYQSLRKVGAEETGGLASLGGERRLLQANPTVYGSNASNKINISYSYVKANDVKSLNIKKEILNVLKNKTNANVSEVVRINNMRYLENNKAERRLKSFRKNKQKRSKLGTKDKARLSNLEGKEATVMIWGQEKNGTVKATILDNTNSMRNQSIYLSKKTEKVGSSKRFLDMFAESLLYVNRLYNKALGVAQRKVLAHMPHFINTEIMEELQRKFESEWNETSSHKIRSKNDMQFAFSYFYFVVGQKINRTVGDMFDDIDTDGSGTWSDREIRTLLTRIYGVPLSYPVVLEFEEFILNCSKNFKSTVEVTTQSYERYSDSKLPTITKALIENCPQVGDMLKQQFGSLPKYKYKLVPEKEQDVVFKMVTSNLSRVVESLDVIRSRPRKFICLNNNMDANHDSKENDLVRAVVQDFYLSLYPKRSTFELSSQYRNRFLHVEELKRWKEERDVIYFTLLLIFLFIGSLALFIAFQVEVFFCFRRACRLWKAKFSSRKYSQQRSVAQI